MYDVMSSDPHKLDEFLVIKDSVNLELSRFLVSEKREKNLRRELEALAKVSEAAPVLLTCHTLDDLCDFVSRLVAYSNAPSLNTLQF